MKIHIFALRLLVCLAMGFISLSLGHITQSLWFCGWMGGIIWYGIDNYLIEYFDQTK